MSPSDYTRAYENIMRMISDIVFLNNKFSFLWLYIIRIKINVEMNIVEDKYFLLFSIITCTFEIIKKFFSILIDFTVFFNLK